MTVLDLNDAINSFREQGFSDAQISIAFGKMYIDGKCNYEALELSLSLLHMQVKPEFKAMTDEERKAFLKKAYNMK